MSLKINDNAKYNPENNIHEREGVIKYRLEHREEALADTLDLGQINAWRSLLFRLELIGQVAEKYHGLGYGNISQRLTFDKPAFLISGTQTGHLPLLTLQHFAIVEDASAKFNRLFSRGPCRPSSEALTHASIYQHQQEAQAVIHVHCPEIWRQTQALNLAHTAASIAYGSVAMTEAVEELLAVGKLAEQPIFSMLGHEDGVVAFGRSMSEAGLVLLQTLANALALEQARPAV